MSLKQKPTPNHLAIIQDGNRRYAQKNGHSAYKGHKKGVEATERILELCRETEIKHLTVYAFSTENFKREKEELDDLFKLFKKQFNKIQEDKRIHRNEIRLRAIGRIDLLPEDVKEAIRKAEEATRDYNNFYFNIAIAYGSQKEIADSIKKKIKEPKKEEKKFKKKEEFTENLYPHHLEEETLPEVDLLIRTGKEKRLSNFLLWRSKNSVVYFSGKYWPEFGEKELKKALTEYRKLNK